MTRKHLALVAPLHNEEGNLERFYERARLAAETIAEEVDVSFVFVDDASTDASADHLSGIADGDDRVTVVRLVRNFGSHMAIKCGLGSVEADYYACLSTDLQDPPELIAEFFRKVEEDGTDVVWGVQASHEGPASKKIMTTAFYGAMRRIALPNLPEKGVHTFLISRRVRDSYLAITEGNTTPYYLMLWLGYPQSFVPYHRDARNSCATKWTFFKRLTNAIDSILSFSSWPIRLITYVGIGTCAIAFAIAGWLLINKLFGSQTADWTGTALLITLAIAIQTLMLAILAQHVWRISDAVRGRPDFLVDQVRHPKQVVLKPVERHDNTTANEAVGVVTPATDPREQVSR